MNQTDSSAELRIRIAKYRAMARLTTDQETAGRIHGLADELEIRLRDLLASNADAPRGPN